MTTHWMAATGRPNATEMAGNAILTAASRATGSVPKLAIATTVGHLGGMVPARREDAGMRRLSARRRGREMDGPPQKQLGGLAEGLRERRMGVDRAGQILGERAHLDGEGGFRDQLARVRANQSHAEQPPALGLEDELGEPVRAA